MKLDDYPLSAMLAGLRSALAQVLFYLVAVDIGLILGYGAAGLDVGLRNALNPATLFMMPLGLVFLFGLSRSVALIIVGMVCFFLLFADFAFLFLTERLKVEAVFGAAGLAFVLSFVAVASVSSDRFAVSWGRLVLSVAGTLGIYLSIRLLPGAIRRWRAGRGG